MYCFDIIYLQLKYNWQQSDNTDPQYIIRPNTKSNSLADSVLPTVKRQ